MFTTRLISFFIILFLMLGVVNAGPYQSYPQGPQRGFESSPDTDRYQYRFEHHYSNRMHIERDMNEKGYLLRVYPGGTLKAEDISARAEFGRLRLESVRGHQDSWQDNTGAAQGYFRSSSTSSFSRSIRIPRDADIEKMTSRIVDGVLVIELPKMMPSYR